MLRHGGFLFCALVALSGGSVAHTQSSADLAFDVASVKPNLLRRGVRLHGFPGDRFEATNVPLRDLILVAYGEPGQLLPDVQMSGGPSWLDEDRFDVSAKVTAGTPSSVANKQSMLRTLLAQRFKLAVHHETVTQSVFELVAARKDGRLGPQLRRAASTCESLLGSQPGPAEGCILSASPSGALMLRGQTMGALANALTQLLNRMVVDRTGLAGGFDADAQFDPRLLPGMTQLKPEELPSGDAGSLATALQEQLGLRLQSTRGPVRMLIVDRVERPTEN